jgi:hypothetical protein
MCFPPKGKQNAHSPFFKFDDKWPALGKFLVRITSVNSGYTGRLESGPNYIGKWASFFKTSLEKCDKKLKLSLYR